MPQIKVHLSSEISDDIKSNMAITIRDVLLENLNLSEEIGQVILYETPPKYRAIHKDRDINFILIEVTMYQGRSQEVKENLMKSLVSFVHTLTAVPEKDIICTIYEISSENYYGGVSHKYIKDLKNNIE